MPLPLALAAAGTAALVARVFAVERRTQEQFPSVPLDWFKARDAVFRVKLNLCVQVKAWSRAKALCEEYVAAHGGDTAGWVQLCSCSTQLKAWTKALEAAEVVLEREPLSSVAHYFAGVAKASLYDGDGAKKHLERFLFLEPKTSLRDDIETWLVQLKNARAAKAPRKKTRASGSSKRG